MIERAPQPKMFAGVVNLMKAHLGSDKVLYLRAGRVAIVSAEPMLIFAQLIALAAGVYSLVLARKQVDEKKRKELKRSGIILIAASSLILFLVLLIWIVNFSGMVGR